MLQSFCHRNRTVAFSTLKRFLPSFSDSFKNSSSRSKSDIPDDSSIEAISKTTTGNTSTLSTGLSKNSDDNSNYDNSNENDKMSKSSTPNDTSQNDKTTNRSRPLPKTTDDLQRRMREDFFRREADWEKMVDFDMLTADEKVIHQCHKEAIQGLLIFHCENSKYCYPCNSISIILNLKITE